jgi:solute carrier family 25 phosphate transporter 23/24/25/41
MAGSLAGMTSDSILYPLEVVSTRVTLDKGKYGNFMQALAHIAKKEGIRQGLTVHPSTFQLNLSRF